MACDRSLLLVGTCSLLLAAPLACDPDPIPEAPTLDLPNDGGTGGDDGGTSLPDGGDGFPDDGADDRPDGGDDTKPDDGADDRPDDGPEDGTDSRPDTGDDDTTAGDTMAESGSDEGGSSGGSSESAGATDAGTGGPAGDCCEANGTPSCEADACATAVCGEDPFCCDTQWDDACVSIAAGMAACDCAGAEDDGPLPGDCCMPHASTGCEIQACEDIICGADPFCCDDQWDDLCVQDAEAEEACGCDVGEGSGSESGDPGDGNLVINEVLYDHPGADVDVFIEIAGEPGTGLTGVTLEAVNGNGGAVYATLDLSGTIGADGIYLIVDPAANATLQAAADAVDTIADLQNGPDSVRLLVDGTEVDALGYGNFAGAVFAGEGDPAEDIATDNSLSRMGDTDDNATDFAEATPTPGAAN